MYVWMGVVFPSEREQNSYSKMLSNSIRTRSWPEGEYLNLFNFSRMVRNQWLPRQQLHPHRSHPTNCFPLFRSFRAKRVSVLILPWIKTVTLTCYTFVASTRERSCRLVIFLRPRIPHFSSSLSGSFAIMVNLFSGFSFEYFQFL